jgi:PE-PPE domain
MKIAGKYVGHGIGPSTDESGKIIKGADQDPKYPKWKDDLRQKFSYAREFLKNDVSDIFTEGLLNTTLEAQRRWNFPVTGIIDAKFQYKMKWATPPPRTTGPRGTLYTCQGTVPSDMWWGPQAEVARAVEDLYYWQPINGPYQAVPMNNSINVEKAELRNQIARRPVGDKISAYGYSQGGIVVSEVYQEMKNPSDPLHYRFNDWYRACTIGNPSRELGVANGNKWCGFPSDYPDLGPNSRGIMEEKRRMKDTPDWWMDFAHKKDMYCDTPNTEAGENQTAICMMIMGNFLGGPDDILHQIYEMATNPIPGAMGLFQALFNAGLFFGGGIKPHVTYNVETQKMYFRS